MAAEPEKIAACGRLRHLRLRLALPRRLSEHTPDNERRHFFRKIFIAPTIWR